MRSKSGVHPEKTHIAKMVYHSPPPMPLEDKEAPDMPLEPPPPFKPHTDWSVIGENQKHPLTPGGWRSALSGEEVGFKQRILIMFRSCL